ncbi:MAG: pirin family protein [Planctomycetota bacterium]|jgi:redox-sensitive bicupin YhaK (pirin superfamily)
MINILKSENRGQADYGWLKARYTFSFAHYFNPKFMGFRRLRVMNEDRIAAGGGFPTHPHDNMEIVTFVMSGGLKHKDSLGNEGEIKPGVIQRMSAGTGIRHSEENPTDQTTHLYQIWIEPSERDVEPGWEERQIPEAPGLRLIASPEGTDGSTTINAPVKLWAGKLAKGETLKYSIAAGRHGWLQVTDGKLELNGKVLNASDGAAISDIAELELKASEDTAFLLFDLD